MFEGKVTFWGFMFLHVMKRKLRLLLQRHNIIVFIGMHSYNYWHEYQQLEWEEKTVTSDLDLWAEEYIYKTFYSWIEPVYEKRLPSTFSDFNTMNPWLEDSNMCCDQAFRFSLYISLVQPQERIGHVCPSLPSSYIHLCYVALSAV